MTSIDAPPSLAKAVKALAKAIAALGLLSACQAVQTRQSVDVLAVQPARCPDSLRQGPSGMAFHAKEQWQAHLGAAGAAVRSALSAWEVDASTGLSVALISAGPLPNPGYRISMRENSLPVREQTLQVKVLVESPPGHEFQAQVIAFSCVYLKLQGAIYRALAVEVQR